MIGLIPIAIMVTTASIHSIHGIHTGVGTAITIPIATIS
jgi:hypothetical protein